MKKIQYNKLVRDKIPQIIETNNKQCIIKVLENDAYIEALKNKLIEESREVQTSNTKDELIEELADVLEVIEALQKIYQIEKEEINEIKQNKAKIKGSFNQKLFLESVIEK